MARKALNLLIFFPLMTIITTLYASNSDKSDFLKLRNEIITRKNGFYYPDNRWTYQHMGELYPNATLFRGAQPATRLEENLYDLSKLELRDQNKIYFLSELAKYRNIDALVILKDGKLIYEDYFNGQDKNSRHQLNSISKSITHIAIQPLVDQGKIDLDKTVKEYLPELINSGWADATIAQVLAMTTSLNFTEYYDKPDSGFNDLLRAQNFLQNKNFTVQNNLYGYLKKIKKADLPHGKQFHYATPNTDVMCWIAEKVTGKPSYKIIEENVWAQIGAERDAYILLDSQGHAFCGAGISATARDTARFGLLVLNSIKNKTPRFNSPVFRNFLYDRGSKEAYLASFATDGQSFFRNWGYNNFWWFTNNKNNSFSALGINGQLIQIDPQNELIVVVHSSFKDSDKESDWQFLQNLSDAITHKLTTANQDS